MQMVTNYKTNIINILMASMTILLLAVFVFDIKFICIFEDILHFRGPACGLTRSFKEILNLNLLNSIKEHYLGIPIFISIIIIYIVYFLDVLLKKDTLSKLYKKISDHYVILLIILIILTIINNIKIH